MAEVEGKIPSRSTLAARELPPALVFADDAFGDPHAAGAFLSGLSAVDNMVGELEKISAQ